MYPNGGIPLVQWLLSPMMRWHLASIGHKAVSLAAGAGVAYYAHTRWQWEPWKIAAAGLGTAYGTSLVLHTAGGMMTMPQQAAPQPFAAGMQPPALMPGGQVAAPQAPPAAPQAAQAPQASNVVELRPEQRRAAKGQAAEYTVPSNLNAATIPPPPPPGTGTMGR